MKCRTCRGPAIIDLPRHNANFCAEHFMQLCRRQTMKAIDDFESVWRYVWDIKAGMNIWEPNLFECHFVAVTLPKPGGLIIPGANPAGS